MKSLTIVLLTILAPVHTIYKSNLRLTPSGYEFQPRHPVQLLLETTSRNRLMCAASCNQQPACRAIDYDSGSRRCRLFEGDLTTGSIVPSASAASVVGTMVVFSLDVRTFTRSDLSDMRRESVRDVRCGHEQMSVSSTYVLEQLYLCDATVRERHVLASGLVSIGSESDVRGRFHRSVHQMCTR